MLARLSKPHRGMPSFRVVTGLGLVVALVCSCGSAPEVSEPTTTAAVTEPAADTTTAATATTLGTTATTLGTTTTSEAPPETTAHSAKFVSVVERGSLNVGVFNVALLPFADPGDGSGFEPDLAREIARRLFGEVEVVWVPVRSADRFEALRNDTIDLLMRATVRTVSREQEGTPSSNYFLDGVAVTVRADSGISSLADLESKLIGVTAGSEIESVLSARLAAMDVGAEFLQIDDPAQRMATLDGGEVDGIAWEISNAMIEGGKRDDLTTLLVEYTQPMAIWTADPGFAAEVDAVLLEIIGDGTWRQLFARWFGMEPPWTEDELLALPPIDR